RHVRRSQNGPELIRKDVYTGAGRPLPFSDKRKKSRKMTNTKKIKKGLAFLRGCGYNNSCVLKSTQKQIGV
ncbi:MAG: hypothetical protein IIU47_08985, partial [Lachnospiraceae bacterium]|nr:hypothetical protein [Lachnospiraceae bacterium]